MKITPENLDLMLELEALFEAKAMEIIKAQYHMKNERTLVFNEIENIDYDQKKVEVTLIRYRNCSCCPDDTETYSFPTHWLFQPNWKEGYRLELEAKQAKQQKEKENEKVKIEKAKELREKAQYEALKEKYKPKTYLVVFYNRNVNETQSVTIQADNAFRAGRAFYRTYNRKAYYDCIELIQEI